MCNDEAGEKKHKKKRQEKFESEGIVDVLTHCFCSLCRLNWEGEVGQHSSTFSYSECQGQIQGNETDSQASVKKSVSNTGIFCWLVVDR